MRSIVEVGLCMLDTLALAAISTPLISRIFQPVPLEQQVRNAPLLIYVTLFFSLAAAYLALWRAATDFRVFRNMGAYLLLVGLQLLALYFGGYSFQWTMIAVTAPVLVRIAEEAMRIPRRRWTSLVWPLCLLVVFLGFFFPSETIRFLSIDITEIFLCILIVQGFRFPQKRDRQVAAAFTFLICFRWTLSPSFRAITHLPSSVDLRGWHWSLNPASLLLLATATLVIYIRDLIQDRREKRRLAAELEAARTVQQMLFPREIPAVDGFLINGIYKPAGEVGGDFFQILPLGNGGLLLVIGDVSGKGMPAAMTVSLLVGTFRTQAEHTQMPAEILTAMNHRTLTHSCGGFTTCLILRADPNGILTIANAGHIAPYLAGTEIPIENGLPLGLSSEATYTESTFQIPDGQQLTLVTDGVVEARNKDGALFGFDRTAGIATEPAEEIARAAQHFGQEDDISVISLTRTSHVPTLSSP